MNLHTEIEINAPANKVWQALTDFSKYPEWNPFIPKAQGEIKSGERLEVHLNPPEGSGMTFRPRLLNVEANQELRWLGHLLIPGLFDGEHVFQVQAIDENRTRFIQEENFKGILVPLLKKSLNTGTKQGFIQMNEALKKRVEQ